MRIVSIVFGLGLGTALLGWGLPASADPRSDFIEGRSRQCPGCDLSDLSFKRQDLSGAKLAGAKLINTTFHDTKLIGANFAGADLTEANLNKADLSRANFTGANLTGA